ncbi:hypothetical protein IAT38_007836 [Cryptococcus sp. DSM 104549]
MNPLISQFISHIATNCFAARSSENLTNSVPFDATHGFFLPLRQALYPTPVESLDGGVLSGQLALPAGDVRDNIAAFIAAVLRNVKGDDSEGESEQAYGDFVRLQQVYREANRLYAMSTPGGKYLHPFMNRLIAILAKLLVRVSSRAASSSSLPIRHARSARSIRDTTRQLIERSMQVASSHMSAEEWRAAEGEEHVVGDAVWPLANVLFRIYSERKLHSQATDLGRTLEHLQPPESARLASRGAYIARTDLCQSYYWRGALGVVLLEIRRAQVWLEKAWEMCPEGPNGEGWVQRRSILIKQTPVNILRGKLPTMTLLQHYNLPQFVPLVQAFKTGNVALWRRSLHEGREWFRRRSIWLVLFERGEILVWRNLFRGALKIHYALTPDDIPRAVCPTWVYVTAMSLVFAGSGEVEEGSIGVEDILTTVASLIDQGFIMGFMAYSNKTLVMKKSPDGMAGFPSVASVTPRTVHAVG